MPTDIAMLVREFGSMTNLLNHLATYAERERDKVELQQSDFGESRARRAAWDQDAQTLRDAGRRLRN